jgi:hypothetical protein
MSNIPEDQNHHFIPQFLLRRWATPMLTSYFWTPGGLKMRTYAPAAVGYVRNLYTLQLSSQANPQTIEMDFFGLIDTESAKVTKLLLDQNHSGQLTQAELSALAVFVVSIRARSPEGIGIAERIASDTAKAIFEETGTLPSAAEINDRARYGLMDAIIDKERVKIVSGMVCKVIDVSQSQKDLVLGDRPLIMDDGIRDAECLLMLPLSPNHVLACWTPDVDLDPYKKTPEEWVEMVNESSISTAEEYVYATGKQHAELVEKLLKRP